LLFSLPFLAYLVFNHWLFGALPIDENRSLAWLKNVQSWRHFIESIASAVLVLGIPCFILMKSEWRKQNKINQNLFFVISISLIINTLVTFGFSYARESRIFALPLLLFFPIFSLVFEPLKKQIFVFSNFKRFLFSLNAVFTAFITLIATYAYYSTDSGGMYNFYRIYLAFVFFFIGYLHFLTKK
jgi:hypothetical protein